MTSWDLNMTLLDNIPSLTTPVKNVILSWSLFTFLFVETNATFDWIVYSHELYNLKDESLILFRAINIQSNLL